MAKNVVVIGTQWGDEGKGKIVDWLTEQAQGVVRFQGGHNAGQRAVSRASGTALVDNNLALDDRVVNEDGRV